MSQFQALLQTTALTLAILAGSFGCATCEEFMLGDLSPDPNAIAEPVKVCAAGSDACRMGIAELGLAKYEDALRYFEQAIQEDPQDDNAHFCAGVACELKGDTAGAAEYYAKASRIATQNKNESKRKKYGRAYRRVSTD